MATNTEFNQHKKPSLFIAYLLLLTLGWLGIHRYYVGKWGSGFLYTISLGFLGFGVLLDIVLLYFLVKEAQQQAKFPHFFWKKLIFSPQPEKEASWNSTETHFLSRLFDRIDNIIRMGLFFIGPIFVTVFSFYLDGFLGIGLFMVFVLIFVGYINNLSHSLTMLSEAITNSVSLSRVPFLPEVVSTAKEFYEYYYHHKPSTVLYYLCYPIVVLLSPFLSQSVRKELNLYKNLVLIILVTLIIDVLFSYSSTYQPYLSLVDAIFNILITITIILFVLITLLIPTITTSFKFRFSGKQRSLKIITTLTLVIMALVMLEVAPEKKMMVNSSFTIENKMEKPKFREDLSIATEMFFSYYGKRMSYPGANKNCHFHQELTELYRQHIQSIVSNDEYKAFTLFLLPEKEAESSNKRWVGVHYSKLPFDQIEKPVVLFLMSPENELFTSWKQLPTTIAEQFTLISPTEEIDELTYTPDMITRPILIEEY